MPGMSSFQLWSRSGGVAIRWALRLVVYRDATGANERRTWRGRLARDGLAVAMCLLLLLLVKNQFKWYNYFKFTSFSVAQIEGALLGTGVPITT